MSSLPAMVLLKSVVVCLRTLFSSVGYYRSIAIVTLDNRSIVGVTILFGTAIAVSIAILQSAAILTK